MLNSENAQTEKTVNEDLNLKLYSKMKEEFDDLHNWIITLPPEEILNNAYEYIVKEDILFALEENNLSDVRANALMKSKFPLNDVYLVWESWETNYMKDIWDAVDHRAAEVVRENFKKSRKGMER